MNYINPKFSEHSHAIIDRYKLKKTATNEWHGPCPVCGGEDRFWISPKSNGELGVNCRRCGDYKSIFKVMRDDGLIPSSQIVDCLDVAVKPKILREHIYEDESGHPLRKAIKYTDGSWKQMRFEEGIWKWGAKSTRNVPYGLTRLLEDHSDKPVFIFEGEKDCERAWNSGLLATTNVGGAGKWTDDLNTFLSNRTVYLVPDNDDAGAKHVRGVKASLDQVGITNAILWNVAHDLPEKGDFSDWMDANDNAIDEFLQFLNVTHIEPNEKSQAIDKINWIRLSDWADRPLKAREWTVDGWIPKGQVTLFYADGGVGKSQIILQLLTSVSLGESWFGLGTFQGRALYLGAEDDNDELHRRFDAVINSGFYSYADFQDVIFTSLAGDNALLADYDRRSKKLNPSSIMKNLAASIEEYQPSLCVIDTLADVFPADENDRALARQFIGMLRKPAIEHNCAMVVLAHPSLSGISTGRGTSGSTGWNNSVRSRITMDRDESNPDHRILKLAKSNYGKIGTEIKITWENGVFMHDPQSSALDAKAANSKARRVFLSLLETYLENGMSVNANGGSTYAPKVFAEHPDREGVTKNAFVTAMKSLMVERVIRSEQTKRGTHLVVLKR